MGGQGGCEQRIEIFEKIHKIKRIEGGELGGGQGGCEQRIEVFEKKKFGAGGGGGGGGGSGWGVRVDVNEELKFL